MPRWPEDTRQRLIDASYELFSRHGFAATSVEQIAEAAGTTKRTFFRQFADKEEVLFARDDDLLPFLVAAIRDYAGTGTAVSMMGDVLAGLAAEMTPERPALERRRDISRDNVALRGRELAKQARWQDAVAAALEDRGFDPEDAAILSAVGFTVFTHALHAWLDDPAPAPDLADRLRGLLSRIPGALDRPVPDYEPA